MNKYQLAINTIRNSTHCESYWGCICWDFNPCDILQELVDKEDRYHWHDLRKDPDDLPNRSSTNIYVLANWNEYCLNEYGLVDFSEDGEWCIVDKVIDDIDVIAWKYIEEFKNE